ncbi:Reverse transcriptase (RNA-dependent DNA polymerase) [Phaeobacter inhibens]|uniref:RNA-directed DNA polymerase n=1 Tax=Phaeobacter inhibens TaxID=221822 RepID=UPI000C9BAD32|nr:RNA-directed DNA polymerase [Phaeobacter inhibens]AUQ58766.1 Reverse transcriptase (RNA-dependent DNA polymerase) [Phaeobacter inhibens]
MTAKTKTQRFKRLISHGFFAPELPPCFVSDDLARYRESLWTAIESIPAPPGRRFSGAKQFVSEPSWFYFPRYGRDDRKHAVINPISYLAISKVLSDNFVQLRSASRKSKISASPLVFDWAGSRALFRPNIDLRDDFRVNLATRHERYVAADIRAFFHSVYTHAIPWAIYGKDWAKQNRQNHHFGNLLDLYCRNAQDGQTIGLPVGPDTSRLIAEVVASAIDSELEQFVQIENQDASRYIDDYTIAVDRGQSGDSVIAAVRQAAANFELELNNDKSEVHLTSKRLPTGWKQVALAHLPRTDRSTNSFLRFFYETGRICNEHPELNVEKFAFQNARSSFVNANEWSGVQSHLINAYRRNSTLVSFLVEILILREVEHNDVDRVKLTGFLERRLPELAQENRTGEIIWLLLLIIRLEMQVSSDKISPLFKIENSMVALMVTHAAHHGMVVGAIDHSVWQRHLTLQGLRSPMWLFAYETVRNGTNPLTDRSFIEQDPFFSLLLKRNIKFFDPSRGFSSIGSALRVRRAENTRANILRLDFLEDFDIDLLEFDEDEAIDDLETDFEYEY